MRLYEELSRLAAGELPADEAAALRARIVSEPDVARAWAELVALQHALADLPEEPPPARLVAAVRGERPARRGWWAAVAVAAAAALWLWAPGPRPVSVVVSDGAHEVSGQVLVAAADVRIDVDGRVKVEVEPARSLARDRAAEVPMDRSHAAAALVGALVTVTVYEGTARVYRPDGEPLRLEAGASRTVSGQPAPPVEVPGGRVASLPPGADEVTRLRAEVADLQAQLAEASMSGAVARGQLALEQGTPVAWPDDVPEALRPAAFEATVRAALASSGVAADLELVDCGEYPCLAVLRPRSLDGDMGAAVKPFVAALEPVVPDIAAALIGTRFQDGDKEVGLVAVALGAPGDLETGGDVGRRTEWRAGTIARDLAEEAMGAPTE
jgi:hypothetical protein